MKRKKEKNLKLMETANTFLIQSEIDKDPEKAVQLLGEITDKDWLATNQKQLQAAVAHLYNKALERKLSNPATGFLKKAIDKLDNSNDYYIFMTVEGQPVKMNKLSALSIDRLMYMIAPNFFKKEGNTEDNPINLEIDRITFNHIHNFLDSSVIPNFKKMSKQDFINFGRAAHYFELKDEWKMPWLTEINRHFPGIHITSRNGRVNLAPKESFKNTEIFNLIAAITPLNLDLSSWKNVKDRDFQDIVLTGIKLSTSNQITEKGWESLLWNNVGEITFDLSRGGKNETKKKFQEFEKIFPFDDKNNNSHVKLENYSRFSSTDFIEIASCCHRLEELNLRDFKLDASQMDKIIANCTHLTKLVLPKLNRSGEAKIGLLMEKNSSSLTSLDALNLEGSHIEKLISGLSKCKLKTLKLNTPVGLFYQISKFPSILQSFGEIESLEINLSTDTLQGHHLANLGTNCSKLKELIISNKNYVEINPDVHLEKHFKKLEILKINCENESDKQIHPDRFINFIYNSPKLKTVEIDSYVDYNTVRKQTNKFNYHKRH